jgi:hypothetical protein
VHSVSDPFPYFGTTATNPHFNNKSDEFRPKSGGKWGKLEGAGGKLVYLSLLTKAEYYNAVLDTADLSAVVRRNE